MAAFPASAVLIQRERRFLAVLTGLLPGELLYLVVRNCVCGGGWLSNLGASLDLGHGLVDFGGATVIFLAGSGVALVALLLFKPEVAVQPGDDPVKVDQVREDETLVLSRPMPSAYLPLLSV